MVEWADATPAERAEGLCNAGVLCAAAPRHGRAGSREVRNDNAKGEYYLTDVVGAGARATASAVARVEAPVDELRGINSRAELAEAEAAVQRALRAAAMEAGVTLTTPETVFLCADTRSCAGRDDRPERGVRPGGDGGARCARSAPSAISEGCRIGAGAIIGPFARLRPGTERRRATRMSAISSS